MKTISRTLATLVIPIVIGAAGSAAAVPCTYTSVAAGEANSCALRSDGGIVCWGSNWGGQNAPQTGPFSEVYSAAGRSCGRRVDGSVLCWGRTIDRDPAPAGEFQSIGPFQFSVCGVRLDGTLDCWGRTEGITIPGPVPSGSFTQVATTDHFAAAVTPEGDILQWGDYVGGPPPGTYESVVVGDFHGCAMHTDGTVSCWNNASYFTDPTGTFLHIATRGKHMCGVRSDQSLVCYYPPGSPTDDHGPVPAGSFQMVATGSRHNCAVAVDGSIACWGSNAYGESTVPPAECPVCGDGVVDSLSEECDDGNIAADDGCSETCQVACPTEPMDDCFPAGKGMLNITGGGDTRPTLKWRWRHDLANDLAAISDPTVAGRYNLCLYPNGGTLAAEIGLPARSGWSRAGAKRYRYKDRSRTFGGIELAKVSANGVGDGQHLVKASGDNLPDGILPASSYVVQLLDGGTRKCWSTEFPTGPTINGFYGRLL